MAADSDGNSELEAVVTCDGDLTDPGFTARLEVVVDKLNGILGEKVKVHKLEPWNSVRVTLSIPREAALRLRQLANEGSQQLRALGILSVQVEGDQVISLRLAASSVNSEPQEIILRTAQDASSSRERREPDTPLANFLPSPTSAAPTPSASSPSTSGVATAQVQFKSPNVVCPPDSVVPSAAPPTNVPVSGGGTPKAFAGPFPFTSMNQAMHCGQSNARETPLPPPYPGSGTSKHSGPTSLPPVTISSPLLVNLLQNDGSVTVTKEPVSTVSAIATGTTVGGLTTTAKSSVAGFGVRTAALMRATSHQGGLKGVIQLPTVCSASVSTTVTAPRHPNIQMNNSISPSALSSNTSIRQNSSTIMTSTTAGVANSAPPPQYHRTLSSSMVKPPQQPLSGFPNAAHAVSSSLANSITSNTAILSHIPFSQQNSIVSQPSLQMEQSSIYQPQQSLPQTKSLLTQSASTLAASHQNITNNNLMQPHSSLSHSKQGILKKNMTNLPQKNPLLAASMQKSLNAPMQQKAIIHNNIASQPMNNFNMAQAKNTLSQHNMPLQKPSNFINQTNKIQSNAYPTPNPSQDLPQAVSVTSNNLDANPNSSNLNNIMLRSLPSPPPYSIAISRPWDTLVHSNPLMDLMPTLTDLKADDLDDLLPSLELTESPLPELPEDFLAMHSNIMSTTEEVTPPDDNRKFLINPLTGELEPQSSDESEVEETRDVFNGLPSPAALSDEDTCSTTRPDTTTDQSDSETRSSDTNKPPRLKNSKVRDRGRDSPALKPEKIKLRLKLEKSEPINTAYKVDVSFINTQPKKASASMLAAGEELRVPPLHISLRGRNSVVIKNKNKLNPDGTPAKPKIRKNPDQVRLKKTMEMGLMNNDDTLGSVNNMVMDGSAVDQIKDRINSFEQKKIKKFKAAQDTKELIATLTQDGDSKSKFSIHNHFKDKQKERRGSDSELVRNNKKYVDNGALYDEKKRRLSQVDLDDDDKQPVLGSTNVGTIAGLPQKPRKDKVKIKDVFRKDVSRSKMFSKTLSEKLHGKAVTLPTAGEMDMEAKFKQGLLEGTNEKGVLRPPHRTEVVNRLTTENSRIETVEKVTVKLIPEATATIPVTTIPPLAKLVEKSPPPPLDGSRKCDIPEAKLTESVDKQVVVGAVNVAATMQSVTGTVSTGSRSPGNSAGQGEDSGIESMDALSEKSPNQASQSPHADLLPPPKTQVPNMLDIEAQLAKMEGLNGDGDHIRTGDVAEEVETTASGNGNCGGEDVNENHNKGRRDQSAKLKQCCESTCALQETLKGSGSLTSALTSPLPDRHPTEGNLVALKVKKEEDQLEPLPVRVTPALYTYSNPDKSRADSESPTGLSDDDSNSCSTSSSTLQGKQSKSLLEQLLIEIPNDHQNVPSSPSPVTRSSVRTRALSKLGSPELSSPVPKGTRTQGSTSTTKRKRNESDSSNHSIDEGKKKPRKTVANEGAPESIKARLNDIPKVNNVKKVPKIQQDESSDSDEPLIEKVRKPVNAANTQVNSLETVVTKAKIKSGIGPVANNNKVAINTRRSVRSNMPAQNTRSRGDKTSSESEALRRKTRSAVSDVESKRKKEVK